MQIDIVAEGLMWPEGPVWMKDESVILVETAAGRVTRISTDGEKQIIATPGGGPNGLALGPDGKLYCCNNGGMICHHVDGMILATADAPPDYETGRIERIDINTGVVERIYDQVGGRRLVAPNDIVFDEHGGFWFSDVGKHRENYMLDGGVFYARPDGSSIARVIDRIGANGISLSPDGKTLYVAVTFERQVMAYEVVAPGTLNLADNFPAPGRVLATFPGRQTVDSMGLTADGTVCVAAVLENPGIIRIDPTSGQQRLISFPDLAPTNICFGGADMRDAWVTLSTTGRLAKVRWDTPGLRLPYT